MSIYSFLSADWKKKKILRMNIGSIKIRSRSKEIISSLAFI